MTSVSDTDGDPRPGAARHPARTRAKRDRQPRLIRRSVWIRQLHRWHWISSAACLIGMVLFAATGVTLNHASAIEAKPTVVTREATLPVDLLARVAATPAEPMPAALADWLADTLDIRATGGRPERTDAEIYVALPRPGGDAWVSVDLADGAVLYEATDRGWIAYFNDLHKGRDTGTAWGWFIDIFAVACLVFCATGLLLLQVHAGNRPATWPIVGLGLAAPLVLVLLSIH